MISVHKIYAKYTHQVDEMVLKDLEESTSLKTINQKRAKESYKRIFIFLTQKFGRP